MSACALSVGNWMRQSALRPTRQRLEVSKSNSSVLPSPSLTVRLTITDMLRLLSEKFALADVRDTHRLKIVCISLSLASPPTRRAHSRSERVAGTLMLAKCQSARTPRNTGRNNLDDKGRKNK